jgi:signal transduction histidine kinase
MGEPVKPRLAAVLTTDALIAVGVAVFMVLGSDVRVADDLWAQQWRVVGPLLPPLAAVALLLAGSLPLALRRLAPLPVLGVCVAASFALHARGEPTPLPLGVLVSVYTVAVRYRPAVSVCTSTAYLALLGVGVATGVAPITDDLFYDYLVSLIATVVLGYGVALGRARAALAERRSAEVAREQEERTRWAVEQEQSRIAREVHDIVAHDVSVIVAQAAAARRSLLPDDGTAQALGAIEAVGRDALDGLRRLMHLLRSNGADPTRSPQPTLDRLPDLLAQVRAAGLSVDLVVEGDVRRLPGTVETNAYRIVQEALTNTLKHANAASAVVVLRYGSHALDVEVRDEGQAAPAPSPVPAAAGSHFGLVGMQQRATLLGGELDARPTASGFRVLAQLPLQGD